MDGEFALIIAGIFGAAGFLCGLVGHWLIHTPRSASLAASIWALILVLAGVHVFMSNIAPLVAAFGEKVLFGLSLGPLGLIVGFAAMFASSFIGSGIAGLPFAWFRRRASAPFPE